MVFLVHLVLGVFLVNLVLGGPSIVLLGFMLALPSFGGELCFNRGGGEYLPARE